MTSGTSVLASRPSPRAALGAASGAVLWGLLSVVPLLTAATPVSAAEASADRKAGQQKGADTAQRTPGRKDAWLYIGWPNNGQVVGTRFKVWFGLRNFGVAPAGVHKDGTGHHHLLIDTDLKNFDEPIPSDKQHLHFGKGQTETVLELPPGRHTLQLVLADADHVPHDPPIMSKKITITVRADRSPQLSAR
ncbi:hypothetical protein J2848_003582 [Azospirillum lipoferum]|uniref:DUF4399 domain-containing protein n=1 Tax=Azospirillum lipoferum TaxID=193 RepID=A0A5A9GLJ1_AZOLI|nr:MULTISPECIES: DUF4399 domain-containing protein [Azospirillum]KAA0595223.1 DUF4399 domain-containing protein [Azospirillum lipoferum]MCP1611904.1 hypothetical protein [Azospirillum lipoferum]MDW5533337.1 DUF4399 domain-containing protein [Azospirillum sp. NL1]